MGRSAQDETKVQRIQKSNGGSFHYSNGDGNVTILDLLRCQKKILGNNNLTDNEIMAVDVNFDGKVSIVDLLRIRKQLLGENVIRQER